MSWNSQETTCKIQVCENGIIISLAVCTWRSSTSLIILFAFIFSVVLSDSNNRSIWFYAFFVVVVIVVSLLSFFPYQYDKMWYAVQMVFTPIIIKCFAQTMMTFQVLMILSFQHWHFQPLWTWFWQWFVPLSNHRFNRTFMPFKLWIADFILGGGVCYLFTFTRIEHTYMRTGTQIW